eukprot:9098876-Alexandrium_andersonii.AAC.1
MNRYNVDLPTCGVFKGVPPRQVLSIQGRLGIEVGRCLLAKDGGERSTEALLRVVAEADARLRREELKDPASLRLLDEAPFQHAALSEAAPAASEMTRAAAPAAAPVNPRVMQLSERGRQLTQQPAVEEE